MRIPLVTSLALATLLSGCGGPPAAAREKIRVRLAGGDAAGAVAAYKEWRGPNGEDDETSLRAMALTAVWSALQSGDPQIRAAATRLAERLNDERLFEAVSNLLRDQDPVVRATAAAAILRGHPDAPGVLADSLAGSDARARAIAIDVLARKIGKDATTDIRKALFDQDPGVRAAACDAAAAIGDTESASTLQHIAASDVDGPVRASALTALGRLGVKTKEIDATVLRALQKPDDYLGARLAAVQAADKLGGEAGNQLAALARGERSATAQVPPAPDAERDMVALRAGVVLARRGNRSAGNDVLISALADRKWTLRAAAANAAVEIAGKKLAPQLLATVARDTIPEVRLAAARALLHAGDRAAAEKVFYGCFGLSEELKLEAAMDLARLGDPKALEVIAALLAHADPAVRRAAAAAAPDRSPVLPGLLDALADSDDSVRLAAAQTIL